MKSIPVYIFFQIICLMNVAKSTPPPLEKDDSGSILVPVRPHDSKVSIDDFDVRDNQGQYHFGFSHAGQIRSELRDTNGNVAGYYSYLRHTGEPTIVFYNSGPLGFKVSSNHLPVALPDPVVETPAVADARKRFLATYNAILARDLANNKIIN